MNAETQEVLNSLYSYIRNYVFNDSGAFIRNIRTIKSNTDLEWFNCASIAQQKRSGNENAVVVNTIAGWEYIMEEEEMHLVDEMIKPIPLLSPTYFEEENYITFDLIDTYYLSDFMPVSNRSYTRLSAIGKVIKNYDKEYIHLLNLLKEGWQIVFIQHYLELFDFFKNSDEQTKTFYAQTLTIVFGKELHITGDKTISMPSLKEKDVIQVYKNVYEIIVSFHIAYSNYLQALNRIDRNILIEPEIQKKQSIGYQKIISFVDAKSPSEREEIL